MLYDLFYIGGVYSENKKDYYMNVSKHGYQFAAQDLHESLINGFLQNGIDLTVLSIPSLSTFPKGNKLAFVQDDKFLYNGKCLGKSFGFINVPFLNQPSKKKIADFVEKWYHSSDRRKSIFVYSLNITMMEIAVRAKKKHPDIQLCIITPDLPRFMGCNRYYKMLGLQKKDINAIYSLIPLFECYVVLSKNMIYDLGISDRPHVVMEGICAYNPTFELAHYEKNVHKVILYTGNIGRKY